MSTGVDELVSDYLARLEAATGDLPAGRRTELLDEISELIAAAREVGMASDEAAVRTMLDRLGEPEDIAAAARIEQAESQPPPGAAAAPDAMQRRPGTGVELAAVLLLTVGSLVLLVGWAVGVVLLWASRRWRPSEKVIGTLVVPGGPGLVFWASSLLAVRTCAATATSSAGSAPVRESQTCTVAGLPPWLGTSLLVAALVAPLVVGALLYLRARARAGAEPAVVEPAPAAQAIQRAERPTASPWGGSEIAAVALLAASTFFAVVLFGPAGLVLALVTLVAGLIFVWSSSQWAQREKWIATAVAAAPAAVSLLGMVVMTLAWRAL